MPTYVLYYRWRLEMKETSLGPETGKEKKNENQFSFIGTFTAGPGKYPHL